jgi:formylglycine-generating enzyme required for sulfatase activity
MIPKSMLLQKPIDLRHKCLFYIGHIPTFLDMMLVKTLGGKPSEPAFFWDIFERGIDPHVDDPDHCHNHSVVPEKDEDWPSLETIMVFRDRVRARLTSVYSQLASGEMKMTNRLARTLVMTHEHEGFHVETLLYMLIQRAGTGTIPPPGFTPPPFAHLPPSIPPTLPLPVLGDEVLVMGHEDNESLDYDAPYDAEREFGWDNESPPRAVHVGKFRAEWRCITNREFHSFYQSSSGAVPLPKSWVKDSDTGKIQVRTVFGPIPLEQALDWPVQTSYDDLEAYAKSKGGRLPTEPELRLFLDKYDIGQDGNVGFRNWNPLA